MSGTSSVPRPTFGPNGFIIPAELDVLAGVQLDYNAAFGGGLNPALETPQGQLASTETVLIANKNDQFLAITQGVDPAYASGRMQDAIARIYFIERLPARPTAVTARCGGVAGANMPAGALARADDGNIYICVTSGVFGSGGFVDLPFQCTAPGPIVCPTGSLRTIYQVIPEWDSITNLADGVVGRNTETRAEFELRRQQSVAKNSRGALSAVQGSVLEVPNVLDAFTTENNTTSPVTLDGVTLAAHSLYVCVAGGDLDAIAQAIWNKKSPGCGYSGDTTRTVLDTQSGYSAPFPSYSVTFQVAIDQPFYIKVTIANGPGVPSNAASLIQTVVLSAFAGSDGGSRARIRSTVYASRYYQGVAALGPWAQIVEIKVGSSAAAKAAFTATIADLVLDVSAVSAGTLAVGQTITGTGIPDGVRITALDSGSGGTGTYTLNLPQTIASETMQAFLPDLDLVAVGLAHVPVLSAANIEVALG